jgi:hypothetical protein
MHTLYRIEDSEGHGMYSGANGHIAIERMPGTRPLAHPLPRSDRTLYDLLWSSLGVLDVDGLHFAFGSLDQLRLWVYQEGWLLDLHEAGYHLVVLETPRAAIGDTQAVFYRDEAVTVETLELTELTTSRRKTNV